MDNKSRKKEQILQQLEAAQQEIAELKIELIGHKQTLGLPYKDIEVYRTVFEQSPLGIGIVSPDTKLAYGNPKLCEMLGYAQEELQELGVADFTFTDDVEHSEDLLGQLFRGEIPTYQLEKRYFRKDRSIFWGMLTVAVVRDEEGILRYSIGMIEDITHRKQIEDVLQHSDSILNLAAEAILSIDNSNKIVFFNQSAEKMFDYKAEEVIGQSLDMLLPIDKAQIHRQHVRKFEKRATQNCYLGDRSEIKGRRKNGELFPAEASILKLNQNGQMIFTVIIRDITWRKKTEEELRQLNAELDQRVIDRTAKLEEANEHLRQEIEKRTQAEAELRKSEQRYRQIAEELRQAHDKLEQRVQERTADLEKTNVTLQTEIKERKQVEEALRQSQQLLETTFNSLEEAVFVLDASTRTILAVNKAVERMFGYTEAEMLGRNTEFLYVDRETYLEFGRRQAIALDATGVLQMEFQVRCKDGTFLQSEHTVTQMLDESGKCVGLIGVVRDITQRKQVEEALQRSEARLKEAQAISNLGNWELDLRTNELSWSDEVFRIFEIDQEKFSASYEAFLDAIHPDDRDSVNEAYTNSLKTMQPYEITHRLLMKDGRIKWLTEQCHTFYDEDGQALRSIGIVRDITQRKQAEDALRQSETSLKEAQAQAHLGHWKLNIETEEIEGSDELFRIFDINRQNTSIDSFVSIVHPDDLQNVNEHLQRAINEGASWNIEYRLLLKDDTMKYIHSIGEAINDESGNPVFLAGTVQDITQRKRAEMALLEQERLQVALIKQKEHNALKDRFMSMVSHEFRTPLSVIRTSSQLLERYTDKMSPEKRQTHLDRIATQTIHLTEMLDNIVLIMEAETNPIKFNPQPINVREFCHQLVESLQNTIGIDHTLDFTIEDGLGDSLADTKLLRIILTNLLSNAIKYSPKNNTVYFDVFRQDGENIFRIRDEGIGITPEDQKRLFEPYFRAKAVENIKGIGLGLKIVRDFVEIHQGRIKMDSTFGEGTVFTVYLPVDVI